MTFKDARVAQPYVSRSYLAPNRETGAQEQAAALVLLAEMLGGGTTSYLAELLQFEKKVAVYTGAFYNGTSLDDTTFDLLVVPSEGVSLAEAESEMDSAIASFIQNGVDADHLDRIKMQLRASQIYARDNVDAIANRYGRALTTGLTVADEQAWPVILQAVTGDQIVAAARQVLRPETSVTGWLMQETEVTQ